GTADRESARHPLAGGRSGASGRGRFDEPRAVARAARRRKDRGRRRAGAGNLEASGAFLFFVTARKASPPRARAVSVLRAVLEKGARATESMARATEDLSAEDTGLLREIVLGVLRWKSALDAELTAASHVPLSRLAPNLKEILEVALYQVRHL